MHWQWKPEKEHKKLSKDENEDMPEKPKKIDLEIKKEFAKITMTASLGVTVITAPFLKRNKAMKNIHTGAGVLLVGSALWHQFLYQSEKKPKKVLPAPDKPESLSKN